MRYAAKLYVGLTGLEKISKILGYFRPKKTSPSPMRDKNLEGAIQKVNKESYNGLIIIFNACDAKWRNFYKHELKHEFLGTLRRYNIFRDEGLEEIISI